MLRFKNSDIVYKVSSGAKTASGRIYLGKCLYFGFVCIPGGSDRTVAIYDNLSALGTKVEDFSVDGTKKTDGHSHAIPTYCSTGLYLSLSGGSVVIYYLPVADNYLAGQ